MKGKREADRDRGTVDSPALPDRPTFRAFPVKRNREDDPDHGTTANPFGTSGLGVTSLPESPPSEEEVDGLKGNR